MATYISDEVADRNRQLLTLELAFVLEGISSIQEMLGLAMEMLPKISDFEALPCISGVSFDDYILFISKEGRFAPVIPSDSIVDWIIHKLEPAIFDKYTGWVCSRNGPYPPWIMPHPLFSF